MPSSFKRGALPLVVGCALAGCVAEGLPTARLAGAGGVVVRGRVAVQGPAPMRPLLQFPAVAQAPQPSDVAHLKLYLQRMDQAASESFVGALPGIPSEVELRQLKPNAIYRLRLEAEDGGQQRLDDNALDPNDANGLGWSESLVATANLALQDGLSFRLKLTDLPFSGSASGFVDLTEGQFTPPIAAEEVASGPYLNAGTVFGPQVLRYNGKDYVLNTNLFDPQAGLVHVHFNPFLLSPGHADYLPPDLFSACGQDYPDIQEDAGVSHRLVVRQSYLQSKRAGHVGLISGGNLVSVPFYHFDDLVAACQGPPP